MTNPLHNIRSHTSDAARFATANGLPTDATDSFQAAVSGAGSWSLGSDLPVSRSFKQRLMFADPVQRLPRAQALSELTEKSIRSIGETFARRRIGKFRRQELLVGLFELAFVATGVWMLFKNF